VAWSVGNAGVETKCNAIIITRQASGTAKIEPLMAAFNAIVDVENHWSAQASIFVV
jgi:phage terminase large subunit-like protein